MTLAEQADAATTRDALAAAARLMGLCARVPDFRDEKHLADVGDSQPLRSPESGDSLDIITAQEAPVTTDQTDHRAEADRLMREAASDPDDYVGAYEHLLAALHDGQAEQTEWLHRIRDLLAVMAEPKGDPGPCECRRDVEPKPESDTLVEAGPEPAPRVLICTEREADAQREIRRRVITTYQIEDEPAVLRGCDGADMTTAALVWLEQFVEAVDPDTHVAYMGQPTNPQEADQ